LLPDNVFSKN